MPNPYVSISMELYIPCWRELELSIQNAIKLDIKARFEANRTKNSVFTSYMSNYVKVVEMMVKRLESDDQLTIWTLWGKTLEMLDYGAY